MHVAGNVTKNRNWPTEYRLVLHNLIRSLSLERDKPYFGISFSLQQKWIKTPFLSPRHRILIYFVVKNHYSVVDTCTPIRCRWKGRSDFPSSILCQLKQVQLLLCSHIHFNLLLKTRKLSISITLWICLCLKKWRVGSSRHFHWM